MTESICGEIVGGEVGRIIIREKSGERIELGDLLIARDTDGYLIVQVYDLIYGSQISKLALEHLAGLKLEGFGVGLQFFDPTLRNYIIATGKAVLHVAKQPQSPKILPDFFGTVRHLTKDDLAFLEKPPNPMYLGMVRSGSKTIEVPLYVNAGEVLPHHMLVPSTTGRGKSNLVKVMLWSLMGQKDFGVLVLDPHDEYYGRKGRGLKDHPQAKDNIKYYSVNPAPNTDTLIINIRSINPQHLVGILQLSDAQERAVRLYYANFQQNWIEEILRGAQQVPGVQANTLAVLQKILNTKLSIYFENNQIVCKTKIFSSTTSGESTIAEMVASLEKGKIVIVDTSKVGDETELLIGSMIANEIFSEHQDSKAVGKLDEKCTISIVIEEAPRVLSIDKLSAGDNIYAKIAREGRKFKIGLVAITQLTSVIPRDILTNINTKIILGNEMATERNAIINSAAQDLAEDDRSIASLDKGEAIVTSIFTKFAVPIRIPLFDDYVQSQPTSKPLRKESLEYNG